MLTNKPISQLEAVNIIEDNFSNPEAIEEARSFIDDVVCRVIYFDDLPEDLHDILSNHGCDIIDNDSYAERYGQ